MKFTIEVDCVSGTPLPDTYIHEVVEGLELTVGEPVSKLFGTWEWEFETTWDYYNRISPILEVRLTELVRKGYIRYGSW